MAAKDHEIRAGDTTTRLAFQAGFFPGTLWNWPDNAALKAAREHMDILMPGDVMHIPEIRPKSVPCATDRRHRFRRRGVPARIHIQLIEGATPRAGLPYELVIDGATIEGATDGEGWIREWVSPLVRSAVLRIEEDEYRFRFGTLAPIDTILGMQQRLQNISYYSGSCDGQMNEELDASLRHFQEISELEPTGEPDEATQQALLQVTVD